MPRLRGAPGIVWLAASGLPALGQIDKFEGRWTNPESGITAIEIRNADGALRLHVFGRCHPADCDWGEAALQTYAPSVDPRLRVPWMRCRPSS